jgi:hypothetical protein
VPFTVDLDLILDDMNYSWSSSLKEDATCRDQFLSFPHTVHLRLSLQHISDLALLLQYDTLPCMKDLNLSQTSLPHLRSLQLRQVPIRNVIILMKHLRATNQVESLILVNCNVEGMFYC